MRKFYWVYFPDVPHFFISKRLFGITDCVSYLGCPSCPYSMGEGDRAVGTQEKRGWDSTGGRRRKGGKWDSQNGGNQ